MDELCEVLLWPPVTDLAMETWLVQDSKKKKIETWSLYRPGCTGTHSVVHKLRDLLPPPPQSVGIKGICQHTQLG